jgi:hypothetical protein
MPHYFEDTNWILTILWFKILTKNNSNRKNEEIEAAAVY